MRTVSFQSVYQGVLERHGLDPLSDDISRDTQRTIARKATRRLKSALEIWDWQELSRTEERAFRSVWNATRQFRRVGEDNQPDEFYYLGLSASVTTGQGYYKVKSDAVGDPPPGTLPTDTTYFETLPNPEPFIARDQTCRRTIGQVLGVYGQNPSLNGNRNYTDKVLSFQPSERGIKIVGVYDNWWGIAPNPPAPISPNTVFLWYLIPPPEFTMVPYIDGKTYQRGNRVYYAPPIGDGNCYRGIATSSGNPPTDQNFWAIEPMPSVLSDFVEAGVYADTIKDRINGEPLPPNALQEIGLAETEAQGYLQREIDKLHAEGQKHFYGGAQNYRWSGLWTSQPWGGDKVVSLTDVCEEEWIFPPAPQEPQLISRFYNEIVSVDGASLALIQLNTTLLQAGSIAEFVVGPSGARIWHTWQLLAGGGNLADPGQKRPLDYDPATNNKHWERLQ